MAAASPVEIEPGIVIPVARTPHLIAMKVLSVRKERDQDAGDLRALLAIASENEIGEAQDALRLVKERGFDRGKQLFEEFRTFCNPSR